MSKELASELKIMNMRAANITSDVYQQVSSEIEAYPARTGTFLINALIGTSIPSNISFHTCSDASFTCASGNILTITCDDISSESDIADGISNNIIASINKSGVYAFTAHDLQRYVKCRYNGDGADSSYFGITFIGSSMQFLPWNAQSTRGAY